MCLYVDGELVNVRAGDDVLAGGEAPLQIGGNESFVEPEYFEDGASILAVKFELQRRASGTQASSKEPAEGTSYCPICQP